MNDLNKTLNTFFFPNLGSYVYLTQDAGANLKLLFLERDLAVIQNAFPILEVVTPFYHATSAFLGK